jgi:hypothetical protein
MRLITLKNLRFSWTETVAIYLNNHWMILFIVSGIQSQLPIDYEYGIYSVAPISFPEPAILGSQARGTRLSVAHIHASILHGWNAVELQPEIQNCMQLTQELFCD